MTAPSGFAVSDRFPCWKVLATPDAYRQFGPVFPDWLITPASVIVAVLIAGPLAFFIPVGMASVFVKSGHSVLKSKLAQAYRERAGRLVGNRSGVKSGDTADSWIILFQLPGKIGLRLFDVVAMKKCC
jgi:hypothetical protein